MAGVGSGFPWPTSLPNLDADIAICGRTEEKLKNAAEELMTYGTDVRYYVCDVRNYEAVGEMVDDIVADFGQMTGLVNNAAGNFLSTSEDLSPGGFKTVVDIVLHGSFNCTHHFGNYPHQTEGKRKYSEYSDNVCRRCGICVCASISVREGRCSGDDPVAGI